MNESDRIKQLQEYWRSSEPEHTLFMERFRDGFRFLVGGDEQWDPADIEALSDAGKPHLSYNEILPKLNVLVGEYIDNMQQVAVNPRRSGTVTGAAVLTAMAKHAGDLCNSEFEEADCFLNGLTGGEGILHYKRDYEDDPINGDIVIVNKDPADVIFDEHSRHYDVNKGRFVFDQWWWDKEKLTLQYPKKAKEIIGGGLDSPNPDENDSFFEYLRLSPDGSNTSDYGGVGAETVPIEAVRYAHRVRDCWHRSFKKMPYLWDRTRPLEIIKLKGETLKKARILLDRDPQRFKIIDRIGATLHRTRQVGQIVLEDIEDPMGVKITRFPFMRFCPYWFRGYKMGVVDNAKDPQREVNKRFSQTLHVLNAAASGLWFNDVDKGADVDELEEGISAKDGIISYKGKKPEQPTPPQLPTGHFTLARQNLDQVGRSMGVREPMEGGADGKDQSGVAIHRLQLQGFKMAKPIFNRFRYTRQLLYGGVTEFIRFSDIYSDTEIREVVGEEGLMDKKLLQKAAGQAGPPPKPPHTPSPEAMAFIQNNPDPRYKKLFLAVSEQQEKAGMKYQQEMERRNDAIKEKAEEMLLEQIRSLRFGRYGVKISQSPNTPTLRLAYFQQLLMAKKEGMMVPDDIITDASDWPFKDKLMEWQQRQVPAMPQTPQRMAR